MTAAHVVIIIFLIAIIIYVIKNWNKPLELYKNTTSSDRSSSEVTNSHRKATNQEKLVKRKEGTEMSRSDISDDVLRLIESGKISYPKSVSDRNKFIADNLGKVFDSLAEINIYANVEIGSHLDNELYDTSTSERATQISWDAMGMVLMLILVLEDTLRIDITSKIKYDQPTDIATYKAKIRSRVRA